MSIKTDKLHNSNNIDDMLKHIVNEKDKLEKLTKSVMNNKQMNNKKMNHKNNTKKHKVIYNK